jgi:hypothetical protein
MIRGRLLIFFFAISFYQTALSQEIVVHDFENNSTIIDNPNIFSCYSSSESNKDFWWWTKYVSPFGLETQGIYCAGSKYPITDNDYWSYREISYSSKAKSELEYKIDNDLRQSTGSSIGSYENLLIDLSLAYPLRDDHKPALASGSAFRVWGINDAGIDVTFYSYVQSGTGDLEREISIHLGTYSGTKIYFEFTSTSAGIEGQGIWITKMVVNGTKKIPIRRLDIESSPTYSATIQATPTDVYGAPTSATGMLSRFYKAGTNVTLTASPTMPPYGTKFRNWPSLPILMRQKHV